ncbi:MAG: hypothetical protein LBP28_06035 [Coriobacteriales bacterium]|jgi:DNA polymerase-4|nr:hypothetical protein [Coriobacteriales bacterium]
MNDERSIMASAASAASAAAVPVAAASTAAAFPRAPSECHYILHCDMNNFYASVEQARNPKLQGLPVVVGGNEEKRHGIVLAKSNEAKAFGIKTAETLWQARKKCPELIVVPPDFHLYLHYSALAREIYYRYTDLVEPFGPDEAWLDITNSVQLFGSAEALAAEIGACVKAELGVTISIGLSWNKIFAKFGSDYKKPDAITVINRDNYRDIVWRAPVRSLLYVGRATERKLVDMGIRSIGELALEPPENLRKRFGVVGLTLSMFARGEDTAPVKSYDPDRKGVSRTIKSYGNGLTAPHDIVTARDARALVYLLAESVSQRMREGGARARTVGIWIRYATLDGCNRQVKLDAATNATALVARAAWELLEANEPLDESRPIRALSVRASDLVMSDEPEQLALFETDRHRELEELDATIDVLRKRYGNTVVQRGIEMVDQSLDGTDIKRDNVVHPTGVFNQ